MFAPPAPRAPPAPARVAVLMSPELAAATDRHPKYRGRLTMVHELCRACGILDGARVVSPKPASVAELQEFHEAAYLEALGSWQSLAPAQLARFGLEDDCAPFPGLLQYCQLVAGASLAAADQLVHGYSAVALAWSGGLHHAQRARAAGFCFVNDAVLAIMRLQRRFRRVLYVDIDLHHGDAVQTAFEASTAVLTLSLHKTGRGFFPSSGACEEAGLGRARAYVINVPLRDGLGDDAFWPLFKALVQRAHASYAPDCVVLQCGADGLAHDPFRSWNLTHRSYEAAARALLDLQAPLLVLGGGGYHRADAARCFARVTAVCAGRRPPADVPDHRFLELYAPSFSMATGSPREAADANSAAYLAAVQAVAAERFEHIFRDRQQAEARAAAAVARKQARAAARAGAAAAGDAPTSSSAGCEGSPEPLPPPQPAAASLAGDEAEAELDSEDGLREQDAKRCRRAPPQPDEPPVPPGASLAPAGPALITP